MFLSVQGRPVCGSTDDFGLAMVAHSAAPQGPTRTWAPSCASQRPLGSASADPALTSTDKTIAETPQTLHHLMCYIVPA